jgi:uncharacterized protein (TIGR02996 family)
MFRPTRLMLDHLLGANEHALLNGVMDNPFSMDHRLVYADWLEENGDLGRAELIRLQCQYQEVVPQEVASRLGEILASNERIFWERKVVNDFCRDVSGNLTLWGVIYRRGFIEEVRLQGLEALRSLPYLTHLCPLRTARTTDDVGVQMSVNDRPVGSFRLPVSFRLERCLCRLTVQSARTLTLENASEYPDLTFDLHTIFDDPAIGACMEAGALFNSSFRANVMAPMTRGIGVSC